jgi:ABC-type antimicrobial peptide transport system permease subunit
LGGALALSRFIKSLLFGVQPLDPYVIALSLLILSATVVVACTFPAIRATRINPVKALNTE